MMAPLKAQPAKKGERGSCRAGDILVLREPQPTALNIYAMPSPLRTIETARLLPSLRRHGSAGASPSRILHWLVDSMKTGLKRWPQPLQAKPRLMRPEAVQL